MRSIFNGVCGIGIHLQQHVRTKCFAHGAHALHAPFWWLKCLLWERQERSRLVAAYHEQLPGLPRVAKVLGQRRDMVRARWRDAWEDAARKGRKWNGVDDGVANVFPKMVFDPPWSPEMMTEDAKFALGF